MTPQSVTYSAAGGCTTFGFDFPVFEPADLEVLLNGSVQTSGFTLLGASSPDGGAVRFATAPAAGAAITLRRTGKVQVSGSDAPGFLEAKLVAGAHITVTKTSDSSGEHLCIATDIDPAAFQPRNDNLDWVATNLTEAGKTLAGAANAAAQRTALGLDTDGTLSANSDDKIASQKAVKTYVDGKISAVAADLAIDERNILRQALTSSVHGGIEAEALFNGWCDAFNADTIGTNSTGHTYSNSDKLYANLGVASLNPLGSAWNGSGNIIYPAAGELSTSSNGDAAVRSNMTFVGDIAATFTLNFSSGIGNGDFYFGLYASSEDSTWSAGGARANLPSMTDSWYFCISNNNVATLYKGGSAVYGPFSVTNGDAFEIRRINSTFSFSKGTTLLHTWSATSNATLRLTGGLYYSSNTISGIAWTYATTPVAMTLVSNALSPAPASAPAKIAALVLYKAIDASTLNTDVTIEATRDGSTWTAGTLADTGLTIAGFNVLSAEVDVSGQPSGTTVKYRLKTHNTKAQQVKGVAYLTK